MNNSLLDKLAVKRLQTAKSQPLLSYIGKWKELKQETRRETEALLSTPAQSRHLLLCLLGP